MATDPLKALQNDLDSLTAAYDADFAGQSRATRDLAKMDDLIRRARDLVTRAGQLPVALQGPEVNALTSSATEALATYERERVAIAEAKATGTVPEEFALLASTANQTFARYVRHFAGKARNTRDVGLLTEMIDDLTSIKKRMNDVVKKNGAPALKRDVETVSNNLEMYLSEKQEIQASQKQGTLDEQASLLATLANEQFEVYRVHFAGQSRVTRRPALLQRMIDQLKSIHQRMNALKRQGFTAEYNENNIKIVEQNLAMYESELAEIKKARQSTSMPDLMGNLGGAANELFQEYRDNFAGKDRKSVDLALLARICDKLGEIGRQMADFKRVQKNDTNDKNLDIVTQQLTMFDREYQLIQEAQGAAPR